VPVQDPQKLAAALAELINDTGERGRLANAAFAYAKENFSNLTMFERYKKAMTG
jgi:hypothetical protein